MLVKTLATLAEDQIQFPAPTYRFTTICNLSYSVSNYLFCPPQAPGMDVVYTQICKQTFISTQK